MYSVKVSLRMYVYKINKRSFNLNKVVKIQVAILLDDIESQKELKYKDVCKWLYDLSNEVRNIKNTSIQYLWSHTNKMTLISDKPTKSKSIRGLNQNYISSLFNKSYSSNLCCSADEAKYRFDNDYKEILKGEKCVASYKKNQPINIHNKTMKLDYKNNKWYIDISLFSKGYATELGLSKCSLPFMLITKNKKYITSILERIASGEYKLSESQLQYDDKTGKWFLSLGYSFINKSPYTYNPEEVRDNIMGIDLGIKYPAYASFNHSHKRCIINDSEINNSNKQKERREGIIEYRKKVEKRKKNLQYQRAYCGEGSIGHGRKTRMKPVDDIGNKIANFRDTTNHKYSKKLVEEAVKEKCGIIQMENLTGISKDSAFLKNWTYYDLQQKIKYKANAVGIEVILIDPKYTSQRCSECGYIHNNNRQTQPEFKCLKCGYQANADYNASQNIATKNIVEIINETLEKGENCPYELHIKYMKQKEEEKKRNEIKKKNKNKVKDAENKSA